MRPLRVGLLIAGIIVGFIALGLVIGGVVLIWAHTTQRDAEGYYSVGAEAYGAPGYAITSDELNLGAEPNDWFPSGIATIRIRAAADEALFLGVAPRADVDAYLEGVAHSVVTDVRTGPFRATYEQVQGDAVPPPPENLDIWVVQTSGPGQQELTWDLEQGAWVLVVMNADGSPGVDTQISAAVKTGLLLPVGIGLLVFGLLVAVGAVVLIVLSTRGKPKPLPPVTPDRPDLATPA